MIKPSPNRISIAGSTNLRDKAIAEFAAEENGAEYSSADVKKAFSDAEAKVIRDRILKINKRIDGRRSDEVRPIYCEVGFSPRAHGSAIFTRGETQAYSFATLGTPRDAQEIDNLGPVDQKRYFHHYNFPPFCTGEAKPLRGSSRREIGHGALAERALLPVIPSKEEFPYTLRLFQKLWPPMDLVNGFNLWFHIGSDGCWCAH